MMATANFSIFQKTNACRSEILNALTPNTTRYTKLEILSDKGFLVLKDYIGPLFLGSGVVELAIFELEERRRYKFLRR